MDLRLRSVIKDYVENFITISASHISYIGRQILFRRVTIYVRVLLTFCKFLRENLIILIYYQLVRL
jgi:hypothetical protein